MLVSKQRHRTLLTWYTRLSKMKQCRGQLFCTGIKLFKKNRAKRGIFWNWGMTFNIYPRVNDQHTSDYYQGGSYVHSKRPLLKNCFLLRHDDASSHTSHSEVYVLQKNNMKILFHSPYCPDLTQCDIGLFPHSRNH